jgi:chromosome segregation protein
MVLRKLAIFGFKSFADKSELEFGEGITAIVGPNGCGKSNVVDAIRWVFGEQKPTALRSANMQDVIFSGTQNRQPLNFAEVTLTIENTRHILPVEYAEVAITRRVYRNGDSEYRINKTPCRLRDINDLFIDTGIGSNAYTTIENNMINSILSDKAEERRILFEEAAGIGKYKQRRKETQRKLEYTRLDLGRINERVQDKDQDVRALARQVEKANRYRKWYDGLKTLELAYEDKNYRTHKDGMAQRATMLEQMETTYETVRAKIATDESQIETMNIAAMEKENELQTAARMVSEANEKITSVDKDISLCEENIRHLAENKARYQEESLSLEKQIAEKRELRITIEKGKVESETALQRHAEELTVVQEEASQFDKAIAQRKEDTDQLSQQQIDIINAVGEQRNALSALQNKLRNNLDMRDRHDQEIEILVTQSEECKEKLESCKKQLDVACEEHRNLLASRETLLSRIEREEERYQDLFKREKQLEAQIDSLTSQLNFLKGLDAQFEGYEQGVKTLLTGAPAKSLGIVADLIQVADDKMASIVDRILGPELQTVVYQTDADLRQAVDFLNGRIAGTARMVSLERLGKVRSSKAAAVAENCTALRNAIATSDDHRMLADHLFNRVLIAPSADEAMKLALDSTENVTFVSADGVICRTDGTIAAGSAHKENKGIFARKKMIDGLPGQIESLQREYQRVVNEKEICIITRDEAKLALTEVNEKLSTGQRRQQEQETNIKHYLTELDLITDKSGGLRGELAQIIITIGQFEQEVLAAEKTLAGLQEECAVMERRVDESKGLVAGMEQERAGIMDKLTNAQLRIQGDKHKIAQDDHDIQNLSQDINHLENRKQKLQVEGKNDESKATEFSAKIANLKEVLEQHKIGREQLAATLSTVREEYNGMLNKVDEMRQHVKQDRTQMDEMSKSIFELKNQQTRAEEKLRAVRERMFEAYRLDMEEPSIEIAPLQVTDQEAEESIKMYKERLQHLNGQVNMGAPEEYETKNKELMDLIKQRDDLQAAVEDLEQAIKKLNKEARVKFIETFELVKQNFSAMFTSLFEGGEVHLSLEENVDPLEAAIQINARPAGKKMRGVQLLSGGERALTAISLLFGLYLVKPSAYCILDELDAPLDEANIERFVNTLRKFSEQTQFIVITHNKRTMEAADVLYGVTQQERGVSTIVSVRLEEAMRHAA